MIAINPWIANPQKQQSINVKKLKAVFSHATKSTYLCVNLIFFIIQL